MSNEIVLSAKDLGRTYKQGDLNVEVLSDVNLDISKGERVAIIGSSGSGKSTLLHLLGGLDTPSTGSVSIAGQNVAELNQTRRGQLRNKNVGFVYQFHHLLPEFTALENVSMPLLIRGESKSKAALELNSELGTSFLVVTHDTKLAARMERVMTLTRGSLSETTLPA